MATVIPTVTTRTNHATYAWADIVTADTVESVKPSYAAIAASISITGTFAGGTTAVLQGSNDGINWFTVKDMAGADISTTAAAAFDFSSAFAYFRLNVTSGANDSITGIVVAWK